MQFSIWVKNSFLFHFSSSTSFIFHCSEREREAESWVNYESWLDKYKYARETSPPPEYLNRDNCTREWEIIIINRDNFKRRLPAWESLDDLILLSDYNYNCDRVQCVRARSQQSRTQCARERERTVIRHWKWLIYYFLRTNLRTQRIDFRA